jgi:hypothetical protein
MHIYYCIYLAIYRTVWGGINKFSARGGKDIGSTFIDPAFYNAFTNNNVGR